MKPPFGLSSQKYCEIAEKRRILKQLQKHYVNFSKREQTKRMAKNLLRLERRIKKIEKDLDDLQTPRAIDDILNSEFFKFCIRVQDYFKDNSWDETSPKYNDAIAILGAKPGELPRLRRWYVNHLQVIDLIRQKIRRDTDGMTRDAIRSKYLTDSYLRRVVRNQYEIESVPTWLIDAKREQLSFYRSLKKLKEV